MRFSQTEKEHLLRSWMAISFAFSVLYSELLSPRFIIFFLVSLLTVGLGFIFHELAHKLLAQRYGCWAEFRSDTRMLLFAILSSFFGFILAAPGAVLIKGRVTKRQEGIISAAGPLTNILFALFFAALWYLNGSQYLYFGFRINSFLALFNMIPLGFFDGRKIYRWDIIAYSAMALISLMLVFYSPVVEFLLQVLHI